MDLDIDKAKDLAMDDDNMLDDDDVSIQRSVTTAHVASDINEESTDIVCIGGSRSTLPSADWTFQTLDQYSYVEGEPHTASQGTHSECLDGEIRSAKRKRVKDENAKRPAIVIDDDRDDVQVKGEASSQVFAPNNSGPVRQQRNGSPGGACSQSIVKSESIYLTSDCDDDDDGDDDEGYVVVNSTKRRRTLGPKVPRKYTIIDDDDDDDDEVEESFPTKTFPGLDNFTLFQEDSGIYLGTPESQSSCETQHSLFGPSTSACSVAGSQGHNEDVDEEQHILQSGQSRHKNVWLSYMIYSICEHDYTITDAGKKYLDDMASKKGRRRKRNSSEDDLRLILDTYPDHRPIPVRIANQCLLLKITLTVKYPDRLLHRTLTAAEIHRSCVSDAIIDFFEKNTKAFCVDQARFQPPIGEVAYVELPYNQTSHHIRETLPEPLIVLRAVNLDMRIGSVGHVKANIGKERQAERIGKLYDYLLSGQESDPIQTCVDRVMATFAEKELLQKYGRLFDGTELTTDSTVGCFPKTLANLVAKAVVEHRNRLGPLFTRLEASLRKLEASMGGESLEPSSSQAQDSLQESVASIPRASHQPSQGYIKRLLVKAIMLCIQSKKKKPKITTRRVRGRLPGFTQEHDLVQAHPRPF